MKLATVVLGLVVHKFASGLHDRITVGMDDSPTSRYGKHVEGAGVHHNPTPGPADGEWLYGHNWVALAWLATHPGWGVIALPLDVKTDLEIFALASLIGLLDEDTDHVDYVPVHCQPGDAVFFDSYAPHRSQPNRTDQARRVFATAQPASASAMSDEASTPEYWAALRLVRSPAAEAVARK